MTRIFDQLDNLKLPFNRFFLFLSAAILLALTSLVISLRIYQTDGSEALDLSAPGYKEVRSQTKNDTNKKQERVIEPTGAVDEKFSREVNQQFKFYFDQVKDTAVFGNETLSDQTLDLTPHTNGSE